MLELLFDKEDLDDVGVDLEQFMRPTPEAVQHRANEKCGELEGEVYYPGDTDYLDRQKRRYVAGLGPKGFREGD